MKRGLRLAAGVCLVTALGGLRGGAVGPVGELIEAHFPAPEFPSPGAEASSTTWINASPLTMQELHGKVVLIDFWEYTCINCIRAFPESKKWYERYKRFGFTIIGVHDPEFDIAYPVDRVETAVKRFGLTYSIVVDNDFVIWKSYRNSTWPNRFLIDASGIVRFHRPGEGGDAAFETAIQMLLREAHPGLVFPSSYSIPPEHDAFAPSCGIPTEEMYIGDWFGRGILANPEGYHPGKTVDYHPSAHLEDGHAALIGRWETNKNAMIYRGKPRQESSADQLRMRYHARELYAVMNVPHGRRSRVYIQQDGKDLTSSDKGVDIQLDSQGHSYLEVAEARMYYLVLNTVFGSHTVTLSPTSSGLAVNSFTFGNDCQTDFPHL